MVILNVGASTIEPFDFQFCVLKTCNNIVLVMSNLSWLVWENECDSEEAFQPSFNKMLIFPPPWSCLGRIKKKKKICLIILNKFRGKQTHFSYLVTLKVFSKTTCFVTTSNTFKYCYKVVFLFQNFLVILCQIFLYFI